MTLFQEFALLAYATLLIVLAATGSVKAVAIVGAAGVGVLMLVALWAVFCWAPGEGTRKDAELAQQAWSKDDGRQS